jgi:hypothetical protein
MVGSVASGTSILVEIISKSVSSLSVVSKTGSYNDLKNRPATRSIIQNIASYPTSTTTLVCPKAVVYYAPQYLTNSCKKIWAGTQAQYDALTPESDTLYFITNT